MAASLTDRIWRRASRPDRIEEDLAALWREASREGPIARALMSNLVVYRYCPAEEHIDLADSRDGVPIEEIAHLHPSRVLLLHHARSAPGDCEDLSAALAISAFGTNVSRFGVEEIAIRSTCGDQSLPSIVRRIARGDVPTSLWWTEDVSRIAPIVPLAVQARQLLFDSRDWRDVQAGARALAALATHPHAPNFTDLNWRRLGAMRLALTHALGAGPEGRGHSDRLESIRVRHRPGTSALAWLLIGWLESRLGSGPDSQLSATVDETADGDEVLFVSIGDGSGDDLTAAMSEHRVTVSAGARRAPLTVAVPHESIGEAVASELSSLRRDVSLHEALAALEGIVK